MIFYSKAKTLNELKKLNFNIPKILIFTSKDFKNNHLKILFKIKKIFKKKIAIRSSSFDEDQNFKSNAGKFKSFLNVKPQDHHKVKNYIHEIIKDYKGNNESKNEIFVQDMVQNVKFSGVCTTRDINTSLPYFCINYTDSANTTLVTSGASETKTYTYLENSYYRPEKKFIKIFNAAKKLIHLFKTDSLDIEFAFDKSNKLFILQVRPIFFQNNKNLISKNSIEISLNRLRKKIIKIKKKHYDLLGNTSYFGVMPDWNPAEIIGMKPKPLALSLYQELVTDHVWSENRKDIGYRDVTSHHLITSFFGTPYVDLRVDFNSWIPKNLSNETSKKIINFYLEKFKKNLSSHDKIEFDIVFTCYSFLTKTKINKDLKKILNNKEKLKFLSELKNITYNTIKSLPKNLKLISELKSRRKKILTSDMHEINKIYYLIEDCKRYGTYAFSGIARCAFLAIEILNSLVHEKIITENEKMFFLNSINTINKKMKNDFTKLSKISFIKKYGHLRPDTYEITSLNYKSGFSKYFNKKILSNKTKDHQFEFSRNQIISLQRKLKKHKLNLSAKSLIKFIRQAIEEREMSKFIFSSSINSIFENLQKFGKKYNIDKKNLSFIKIHKILDLHYNVNNLKTIKSINSHIKENIKDYKNNCRVTLPEIILNEKNLYSYYHISSKINYITNKNVSSKIINLKKLKSKKDLVNKIVCIENADPGYDYLFNYNIKGLITRFGGINSHMAIRCAELNIPAMIGVGEINFNKIIKSNFISINCTTKNYNLNV